MLVTCALGKGTECQSQLPVFITLSHMDLLLGAFSPSGQWKNEALNVYLLLFWCLAVVLVMGLYLVSST